MSKPFILCSEKGLGALPGWLDQQSFKLYSTSFGSNGMSISLGVGEGRSYRKVQSIIVKDEELLDRAESIVRQHLGWPDQE
ncbi:hypothetical protein [Chromohalobacter canadensis]|uniref:hypothetical protein n=1 Tax=Chromohalobacter canadensis TaxID=141389 RepID=UPI00240EA940|nr:hypothetical protein [Chromohalobacter canadensis]